MRAQKAKINPSKCKKRRQAISRGSFLLELRASEKELQNHAGSLPRHCQREFATEIQYE